MMAIRALLKQTAHGNMACQRSTPAGRELCSAEPPGQSKCTLNFGILMAFPIQRRAGNTIDVRLAWIGLNWTANLTLNNTSAHGSAMLEPCCGGCQPMGLHVRWAAARNVAVLASFSGALQGTLRAGGEPLSTPAAPWKMYLKYVSHCCSVLKQGGMTRVR